MRGIPLATLHQEKPVAPKESTGSFFPSEKVILSLFSFPAVAPYKCGFVVFILSLALVFVLCSVSSNPLGSVHTGGPTNQWPDERVGGTVLHGSSLPLVLRTRMALPLASVVDVLLMESLSGLPGYHPGLPWLSITQTFENLAFLLRIKTHDTSL